MRIFVLKKFMPHFIMEIQLKCKEAIKYLSESGVDLEVL